MKHHDVIELQLSKILKLKYGGTGLTQYQEGYLEALRWVLE